jgi:putative endonuclease
MPFMYILECGDRSLCVGSTWDLERRLAQHQDGEAAVYTKNRLPVRLLSLEQYDRIKNAFLREKQVQRWGRAKRLALVTTREVEWSEPQATSMTDAAVNSCLANPQPAERAVSRETSEMWSRYAPAALLDRRDRVRADA